MKNFTRPKGEKPAYYASTVEDGEVVQHNGDLKHAMYHSEIEETQRRANLYHEWIGKNYRKAFNGIGFMNTEIWVETTKVRNEFMNGERIK